MPLFGSLKNRFIDSAISRATNINVGGLLSGNPSISGTLNSFLKNSATATNLNSDLKSLYENDSPVQSFQYPNDLDDSHYIIFNVTKRIPHEDASINQPLNKERIYQTITLPLPVNLVDGRSVNYNTPNLGIVGAMGAGQQNPTQVYNDIKNALTTYGGDAASKVGSQVTDLVKNMYNEGDWKGGLATAATLSAASQLGMVGGLGAGVLAAQYAQGYGYANGIAYNPRMAVLFDNVNFREFDFSYRLIARNPTESEQITNIVRAFQYHMAPSYLSGLTTKSAFQYPNEFQIEFAETIRPHLFEFKPCVLTNVNVTYNQENGPSFFKGTEAPVVVDLTLHFKETKIITKESDVSDDQKYDAAEKYGTNFNSQQTAMLAAQDAEFNEG